MEKLECTVENIVYQNEINGFTVIRSRIDGYVGLKSVVGIMHDIKVGAKLEITGDWKEDKYGRSFNIRSYIEKLPSTIDGIEKYLGSGLVKGIGPKFAKAIVDTFGKDTFKIMEDEIDRLIEVPGIGKDRLSKIKKAWIEQKGVREIMVFLQGNGINATNALKIYKKYGDRSIEMVKENPYRLIDEIDGIGFKTSDSIALGLGYERDDPRRCKSGIYYSLKRMSTLGHVYSNDRELIASSSELLEISEIPILKALEDMISHNDLKCEINPNTKERAIYLSSYYWEERGTAKSINFLLKGKVGEKKKIDIELVDKVLEKSGIEYDPVQIDAIRESVKSKVMVLTGGPGTGKTTTTVGIINTLEKAGLSILLAAPTGRASKRMNEATDREDARTIHNLLEYSPIDHQFHRNRENPLESDVVIIDEASMVDISLIYSLLDAMTENMRLILVGDVDQLPSVGPGNVLHDIIDSKVVPVVKLTKVFRQAQSSDIVINAHKINNGSRIDLEKKDNSDFYFIEECDQDSMASDIVSFVNKYIPENYEYTPKDIQVLTPMKKGPLGTVSLNIALQSALNRESEGITYGSYTYKKGDKVMQVRNNYVKGVFNGDIGTVVEIDTEYRTITVFYKNGTGGITVNYEDYDFDELTLAYATTIHKSQGSEYPVVVMPMSLGHKIMLQRNLIYTGLTRAKKLCVIIGTRTALNYSIDNFTVQDRNTLLKERLQGLL